MKSSNKTLSVIGSAIWFVLAPGVVAGYFPWLITGWESKGAFGAFATMRIVGVGLIVPSAAVLAESFVRFALQGEGTPAPLMPTQKLVVAGFYRRVRNPMYVCVLGLILGQAIVFESVALLIYAMAIWFVLHIYVVAFEEPRLRRDFGDEYDAYCKNVKRWRPRLTPWRPEDEQT